MAELLKRWLNEDIKLSVQVTNLERDFSNGFLLGELFHSFEPLQRDFAEFQNHESWDAKAITIYTTKLWNVCC